MSRKILIVIASVVTLLLSATKIAPLTARAQETDDFIIETPTEPTFPHCLDLQGQVKVVHYSGTHGIPGDLNTYTGKDQVNWLSESTLVQCFCPDKGVNGIQTNWWKITDFSERSIETLIKLGWVYIPNGEKWGLQEGPYLAKNTEYVCKGTGGPGDRNSSDDPNDKHDAPKLKYLPATGNTRIIAVSLASSLLFLVLALMLRKNAK